MSSRERMLSVVSAAVAESSRLFGKLQNAEALHAVDRCLKRMTRAIDGFHGRLVTIGRDDLGAVFDNASDACQAAIAMQRRTADLPPVSGIQLAIRIGFHHGPVVEASGKILGDGATQAEGLAGQAGPGQILTSSTTQSLLTPQLQLSTCRLENDGNAALPAAEPLFEVLWSEPRVDAPKVIFDVPTVNRERELRLCVRYGNYVKLLDRHRPSVVMGRDATCEITVHNRRASRNHARIERRGSHFVLTDLSTNGTFVTVNGEQELFLRHEQFILRGRGVISFAASAGSPTADIAEFEHL
jgi:adenylate cyclase